MKPYYQDDLVTLYHGDCLEITEWLAADVLVTDPPYGMSQRKFGTNRPSVRGEVQVGGASSRVMNISHAALREGVLTLWGTRPAVVFGSWRVPRPMDTRMRLIWDKAIRNGAGGIGPWRPGDEEIYLVGNWPNPKSAKRGPVVSSVLRYPRPTGADRPSHPTPKPQALMFELISACPAGVIADPFAGSGSTLVAAASLGRRAIGVEIDESYCEIVASRLSQASHSSSPGV